MSQNRITVGIAGLGRSGWDIHARLLEPLADRYQITAVVDADPGRRQEAAERFQCRTYQEYPQLLADQDVDLVVVALPSSLHASASMDALAAGKHVVCEKPMATSLADADRMVAAAEASDRILTIFQNRRYNPDFRKIQEILASGILGRIVQIRLTAAGFSRRWDWQTLKEYGGGTLNNTGPHFLDLALQLFGDAEPDVVFCHLDRTLSLGDADDHVKLVFKGPNTPTVDIEMSSACAYPGETWNVMGTQGGLAGTTRHLRWKTVDPAQLPPRELDIRPTPERSYNRDPMEWREESWEAGDDTGPGYAGFYLDLYETIRNGSPLAITPQSVRRVVWLQEECHRLSPV